MTSQGIYTLANDNVYDQLVALLNSIEVNVSSQIPVCIIPYDDRLELVKQEIASRPNVTLFENTESIQRWEEFAHAVWEAHPQAKKSSTQWWTTGHLQRKMCAFDGNFDEFVFYDADSLAMKPLTDTFAKFDTYDFIFDDWVHTKLRTDVPLNIPLLEKKGLYQEPEVRPYLHCSDFFCGKNNLFPPAELNKLRQLLIEAGEVAWLTAWWDDAHLFNYLTFKLNRPLFNFTLSPNGKEKTGNCASADPFVNQNNVLYNQDGLKPIHRLHFMEYSTSDFTRLCQGIDVDIPHRDVFLYYRYLKNPELKPTEFKVQKNWSQINKNVKDVLKKTKAKLYRSLIKNHE